MSICDRERQTYCLHERHIRNVVADARARMRINAETTTQRLKRRKLVVNSLHEMPDLEFSAALPDSARIPSGNDRDLNPRFDEASNTVTIPYVKDLQGFAARVEVEASVS